jgi:hypothetical protein
MNAAAPSLCPSGRQYINLKASNSPRYRTFTGYTDADDDRYSQALEYEGD